VKRIFDVALGILAAIGGFVDIGDIVFNVAAGAMFEYQLLWVVVIGVGAIITYSEMCGRVAVVSQHAVFDAVRERLGFGVGLVALVGAQLINLLTLAAEIGGIAVVLQLLAGLPYRILLVLALIAVAVVVWALPFGWIERVFGYCGLAMLVFAVAAIKLHPDWSQVASGFVPSANTGDLAVDGYFVVGDGALRGLLLFLGRNRGRLDARGPTLWEGRRSGPRKPPRQPSYDPGDPCRNTCLA
jgi:manganese transport protein